jgi:DNA-binding NtrC family response regulator
MTTSLMVSEVQKPSAFCGMVGLHPLMLELFDDIRYAAPLEAPVLIEGETGTGKELVAQALHGASGRSGKLVTVNLAELAAPLAEAELFGTVRGAYTGAVTARSGLIMSADSGTLYLDEAGDLPLALQAKLLRVLESGHVRQVGAAIERVVRFRLVLSVQQAAHALVASGRWRQDFFYRVAGITLRVPPLSERRSDIPALANYFMLQLGANPIPADVVGDLTLQRWSGNVRELKRVMERILHRVRGRRVTVDDVHYALQSEAPVHAAADRRTAGRTLRDVEREHIERTIQEVGGDWRAATIALGLSRSGFYRRLEVLGIPRPARPSFLKGRTYSHGPGNSDCLDSRRGHLTERYDTP